ncbi:ribosome-associated Tef1p biogenesis chaperone CHP1 [Rhodotorula paludigena]|uniref:ribosome-associated Tef1p biogenesis chaperone CHP1 n=1 Tax=Rhodotorula paludigena TaxID=86838 RepID=UPI0031758B99
MSATDQLEQMISGGGLGVASDGGAGGGGGGIPTNFNAETAENDEGIEMQFAVMCMEQAEAYFGLITKVRPSTLKRLTQWDDEIMEAFEKHFPDYSSSDDKLRVLDEDEMKSAQGKKRWRDFMMPFECVFSALSRRAGITKKIDEFNFGTLIRTNCEDDYTQENSMFGYRLQFYAIEIARNRRGLNDKIWEKEQAKSADAAEKQ